MKRRCPLFAVISIAAGTCCVVVSCLAQAGETSAGKGDRSQCPAENLVKHKANPVLDVGPPGTWDDGRCGCFTVARVGKEFCLWYMGSSGRNSWRIGLATSADGATWKRSTANPVLPQGDPGRWDDRQVSMPFVLQDGDTLRMWYTGSSQRDGGFGLATSEDGIHWKRHGDGPVLRGIGGSYDPCVSKFGDRWMLWYCGMLDGRYRILQATSSDGIHWAKQDKPVLPLGTPGQFDSQNHAGPCVLQAGGTWVMFYLGNGGKKWTVGLATSPDCVQWTKSSANPVLDVGGQRDWDGGSILGVEVLWLDGRLHVWYAAHPLADAGKEENEQTIRIGYATSAAATPGPPGKPTVGDTSGNPSHGPAGPPLAAAPLDAKKANEIQKQWAEHIGQPVVRTNSIGMRMVLIPPGEFTMGLTKEDYQTYLNQFQGRPGLQSVASIGSFSLPAHAVRISRPCRLGATEVTVAQFRKFADESGYRTEAERGLQFGKPAKEKVKYTWRDPGFKQGDDEPAMHVCWNDAAEFCKWLSKKEGRHYRLPTEAEWEHACRAGTTTLWVCGNDWKQAAADYGWLDGEKPQPVARKKPNPWGLYDMHGNVWEYCSDWWRFDYYKTLAEKNTIAVDPAGPDTMAEDGRPLRPIRGGSWDFGGSSTCASRVRIHQMSHQHRHLGFRVALTISTTDNKSAE